ncbi:Palmitoyltransferase pfa4, partial [Neolecta irregularis DAH-3]
MLNYKILGPYFVIVSVFVILFAGYAPQYVVSFSPIQSIILNAYLLIIWYCFIKSVKTDPGRVPKGWDCQKYCWCTKCDAWKPERAAHCRWCERCVLKMDHHCPWIDNCVGYNNHIYFFGFIGLGIPLTLYLFVTLCGEVWKIIKMANMSSYYGPSMTEMTILVLSLFVLFMINFAVGMLLGFQIWNVLNGQTTIEALRISRAGDCHLDFEFPYDLGFIKNIETFLYGSHKGTEFEKIEGFKEGSWPPEFPADYETDSEEGNEALYGVDQEYERVIRRRGVSWDNSQDNTS